jgi:hypothetical protein
MARPGKSSTWLKFQIKVLRNLQYLYHRWWTPKAVEAQIEEATERRQCGKRKDAQKSYILY